MKVGLGTDLGGGVLLLVATVLAATGRAWLPALAVAAVAVAGLVWLPSTLWRASAALPLAGGWVAHQGPWSASGATQLEALALLVGGVVLLVGPTRGRQCWAAVPLVAIVLTEAFGSGSPPLQHNRSAEMSVASATRIQEALSYFRSQVAQAQIPGAALAVVGGTGIVASAGAGASGTGGPMSTASPVVIGSTAKSITALATYQLVEAGQVDLDAPIGRYLAWYSPRDARAARITARQLLTDASGVPTWAGWKALAGDGRMSPGQLHGLINGLRLSATPGEKFQYSNANYIILGQIIEAVSGQSYPSYVADHIFGPLGMTNTAAGPLGAAGVGHRYWFGAPFPSRFPFLQVGIPAGYVTSTASDLARYLAAHMNGGALGSARVLSAAGIAELHRPAVTASGFGASPGRYAMGWYVGQEAGQPAVFHSGDTFDSSSALIMLPAQRLGVVVVVNAESALVSVARALAEGVTDRLMGTSAPALRERLALTYLELSLPLGLLLGFTVRRVRRSRGRAVRPGRSLVLLRDIALPGALVLGLPFLFSHYLDRAETLNAVDFWRLAYRGLPDVSLVVVVCLIVRFLTGAFDLSQKRGSRDLSGPH